MSKVGRSPAASSESRFISKEVLEIAAQMADALAEAHSHGITHRDIKPANIMITYSRQVKLMDFGLAKTIPQQQVMDSQAQTETLLSEPGMILGTLPYMSPEQVSGGPVDARSDIFSFGAVLYEMASGHNPFAAESAAATISAIVTREAAPLARYSREVPAELERIVSKALRKDREERYQAIKEMALDLKSLKEELEFELRLERSLPPDKSRAGNSVASSGQALSDAFGHTAVKAKTGNAATTVSTVTYLVRRVSQHKRAALILGMIIVAAAVWYLLSRRSSGTKEAPTTLRNATFKQLTDQAGPEYFPSLSPDGKSLVYASYVSGIGTSLSKSRRQEPSQLDQGFCSR
jgi:serine/threonine protein kinase